MARGGNAWGFGWGFAGAGDFLAGGSSGLVADSDQEWAWDTLANPDNPVFLNSDNLHMTMVTGAVSGAWGEDTLDVLVGLAAAHDWMVYPLLYGVLRGPDAAAVPGWDAHAEAILARADLELDELPLGEVPTNPPSLAPASHGYNSSHRYIRPSEQHYVGSGDEDGTEYSGLDWLLLYNLRALAPVEQVDEPPPEGCGCGSRRAPTGWLALLVAAALGLRRRQPRPLRRRAWALSHCIAAGARPPRSKVATFSAQRGLRWRRMERTKS